MSLDPLLEASPMIQFHVATVFFAVVIGAFILFRRKGTPSHRFLGKIWVALIVTTSISTFFIHTINTFHGFSPIHLLSIVTLLASFRAVLAARRHDIRTHSIIMRGLYFWAIGVAGLFTLLPGRTMHKVVFGVPDVFADPQASEVGLFLAHHEQAAIFTLVGLIVIACAATAIPWIARR